MSKHQVVVSGMGLVTPLGIGLDAFWANLSAGRSGVGPVTIVNEAAIPGHFGGECREFTDKKARELIKQKKSIKAMCREIQIGVASATLALTDAGLGEGQTAVAPERLGIDFGANLMQSPPEILFRAAYSCAEETGSFVHANWGTTGLRNMEPLWLLLFLPNMPACHIGIYADARGPSNSLTMAEASGCLAISESLRIMERDSADVMICGTTGTTLHAVKSMHAIMWEKMATLEEAGGDPTKACRPFDRNRSGQVICEGSATLILEGEKHALDRGVKTYGRVLGAGAAFVSAFDDKDKMNIRKAMEMSMKNALRDAGVQPSEIGHINAHAMGDPAIDELEALAIHDVFGDLAEKVPVTALKSYWGNPGASCATMEIAGSLASLQHGVVLPTLNYETPDPKCRLNVVHGEPLKVSNKLFLKTSVTRVGQASAVVMSGD